MYQGYAYVHRYRIYWSSFEFFIIFQAGDSKELAINVKTIDLDLKLILYAIEMIYVNLFLHLLIVITPKKILFMQLASPPFFLTIYV